MSFTFSGPFLLAFALYVFVTRPAKLSYYAVFFAPFSATAIVNMTSLGYKSGGLGLTPAMLFLLLFFAAQLLYGFAFRPVRVSSGHLLQLGLISLFTVIMLTSLLLNGAFQATTSYQLTQTTYVLIGVAATVALSLEFARDGGIDMVTRTARAAAIFVSVWGLLQFACFAVGVSYPSFLFNNSLSDSADMFDQRLGDSYMRIASVAVEPSVLAASLLHFAAFGLTMLVYEPRLRTWYWLWPVGLSLLVLLLSSSSTAYVGLAVLALLLAIARPRTSLLAGLPAVGLMGLAIAAIPRLQDVLWAVTINKGTTLSYADRTSGALRDFGMFLEQPLLGWGWGAARNFNALTATLANTGIIGTTLFLAAGVATLLELQFTRTGQAQGPNWRLSAYAAGAQNALIVAFACSITSGIKYVFLDDWYFWAFAIAIASRLAVVQRVLAWTWQSADTMAMALSPLEVRERRLAGRET